MFKRGLTRVKVDDLKRLLQAIHRSTLPSPVSRAGLVAHGLGNIEGDLSLIVGLDHAGARAVIVAVIAERGA